MNKKIEEEKEHHLDEDALDTTWCLWWSWVVAETKIGNEGFAREMEVMVYEF